MKWASWYILLAAGFALVTAGLASWHDRAFLFDGLLSLDGGVHPLYLLILGIAVVPPALWEIFLAEQSKRTGGGDE